MLLCPAMPLPLWAASVLLAWGHRDPADRLVVALAQRQRARIVTDDRKIREYYERTVA